MRRLTFRKGSWIIAPVLVLGFFSSPVNADIEPGLFVTVYNNLTPNNDFNSSPPIPPTTEIFGTYTTSKIEHYFDQIPVLDLYEDFLIKYEGFITSEISQDISFMAQADDGTILYLDGQQITYDWWDKGGGGSVSEPISFEAGVSKEITLWFYENGGGAWVQLWWLVNGEWAIVPESAFTRQAFVPTTTTTTTSTTTTSTTTIPETTTVPETTTTLEQTTTSSTSVTTTTSTTTTTTTIPETTTTTSEPPKPLEKEVSELIENTENLTKEEIVAAIENIISDGVDSEEAKELSSSPEILNAITGEEAKEIFQEIEVSELSPQEEAALVEAMSDAPAEIKEAFEDEIDIFGEGLDEYVPTGSNVDVKTRRAVIAVTALTTTLTTAPMPSGGTPSAPSGSPSGGGGPSGDAGSNEDRGNRRSRRK